MKSKTVAVLLFILGLTASFTLVAAPAGSGKAYDSTSSSTTASTTTTTTTTTSTVSRGGTLNALSSTSITVDGLTCAISTGSPSTSGFKVGDHVGIGCQNGVLTVLVALPSAGTSSTDSISALSSTSITVGQLTCGVNSSSPSLSAFTVGERVAVACTNGVLTTIVPLPPLGTPVKATIDSIASDAIWYDGFSCSLGPSSPNLSAFHAHEPVYLSCTNGTLNSIVARTTSDTTTTTTPTPTPTTTTTTTATTTPTPTTTTTASSGVTTTGTGTITALGTASITVNTTRIGPLTCALTGSSPSTTGFKVGDLVGLGCGNGVLLVIVPKSPPDDDGGSATHQDPISALSSNSITVGSLTCTINNTSPSLTGFTVGERVSITCVNGALTAITPVTAPSTSVTAQGPITALSSTSITVGSLTCTVGSSSPSLTGYQPAEQVSIGCVDGALTKIAVEAKLALQLGAINALSTSSITVGSLTCSVDQTSPSLTGFQVGDRVGMVCVDGLLGLIVPLPGKSLDTTRKATLRHDLLLRYSACAKHAGKKGCRKATVRLTRATRR